MTHERHVALQRSRMVVLARQLLLREIDVIDAALAIHRLSAEVGLPEDDPDLLAFALVNSEVDALPVGAQRAYWAEEALRRKEPEMIRARAWTYETVRREAERLIQRLEVSDAPDA
jgi:hypothetical protein